MGISDFTIATGPATNRDQTAIAPISGQKFAIAWREGAAVRAKMVEKLPTLTVQVELPMDLVVGAQADPSIAALTNGDVVVVWTYSYFGGPITNPIIFYSVRAQRFTENGAQDGNEIIAGPTAPSEGAAVAALTGGGFAIAAIAGNGQDVVARYYTATGELGGTNEFAGGTSASDVAIAATANGGYIVAWSATGINGGDNADIVIQRFDANGFTVGGSFIANSTVIGAQVEPAIATFADGRFVVAWTDYSETGGDTSFRAVRAQIFDAQGDEVGSEILVNSNTFNPQYLPSVTTMVDGSFIVSWTDGNSAGDGSGASIKAQKFGPGGEKIGPEFLVNTTTTGSQYSPAATFVEDGLVIAWEDAHTDEIRARLFEQPDITSNGGGESASIVFAENGTGPLTTVAATDPDGDTLTYAITGGADAGLFTLDPATGSLNFVVPPDFENPTDLTALGGDNVYEVTITADNGVFSDTQTINVTVTNVVGVTLKGKKKKDKLKGTGEEDVLIGKKGKDNLDGKAGLDTLDGGKHKDKLIGGEDADSFVFSSKLKDKWADKISDMEVGIDTIVLDSQVFKKIGGPGQLGEKFFSDGKPQDKNDRVYQKGKTLYYDRDGSKDDHEAVKFAKVSKGIELSEADFLVI